eukprot:614357-Rhodomonas_salina.1
MREQDSQHGIAAAEPRLLLIQVLSLIRTFQVRREKVCFGFEIGFSLRTCSPGRDWYTGEDHDACPD